MNASDASFADAVVIGAGIIGAAVALELARGGRRVVCVDKGPAAGAGSTSASSSIIRFSYSTRDAVLTSWEAAPYWEDWAGYLGVTDPDGMARFVPTGMLIYDTPGDEVMPRVTALWDEIGIGYDRLDAAALRRRFPGLDAGRYYPPKTVDDPAFGDPADGELTAVFEREAGYVDDPMLAARNLAYAARHHGATFVFHTRVDAIEQAGGRVSGVRLAGGQVIETPVVVNAAGPHSAAVNRLAGVDSGMRIRHRPLRQEVFAVPVPAGVRLEDGTPVVSDSDLGQYFRPQAGGTILVGSVEPECDVLEWVDDADHFDEHTTVAGFERSVYRLARRIPSLGIPHRPTGLAALYDVTDDWVPLYDVSDLPGFFMACGTSGNQFKNAPMAGRFLAALVDATASGRDHDADPVQVLGPRTGQWIDLAAFSRRRDPATTSGTVMG